VAEQVTALPEAAAVLAAVALVVRALVLACRGRYAAFLAEAGESAGTLSTWPS